LGDAVDAAEPFLHGLAPNEGAKLVLNLVKVWARMRATRVGLTGDQFKVLRAIKKHHPTVRDIAAYTGLTEDRAAAVVRELKGLRYKEEIPLVEDQQGSLATKF